MRNAQKLEVLECIESLHQAHEEIRQALYKADVKAARAMLGECQEFAVSLGESIEELEGEGHATVSCLEQYCETLFHVYEEIDQDKNGVDKILKTLRRQLIRVENSAKHDIRVRWEIVFFPYKVSMWDSMESVYLAAKADPDCDVYCVPIPYYDRNQDGSFGREYYEGDRYPAYVEVTDWHSYSLEEHRPDAAYIHNPYDRCNYVTSVHPQYYSDNLKKYTAILVYIPYYVTTGGMSEAQEFCPAYVHADYIVIQCPEIRKYFHELIPDAKFLPFGSPKLDSVIRKCQNPPEPPAEWRRHMDGRKVCFYNTSINGMLSDTEKFLDKMRYVFDAFKGRENACLLWRPHPLLDSTFESMRASYKAQYEALKRAFVEEDIGILDETPDIEETIALSDAYIGDAGTSVTSLFGVAGKPIFLINNNIHGAPGEDDWRGEIVKGPMGGFRRDRWVVTQGNKLYHSPDNDYHYRYYCDLTSYAYGGYFVNAFERNGKVYVCPANAREILVVADGRVEKSIPLMDVGKNLGAFGGGVDFEKYIFLWANEYPYIVRLDTDDESIAYLSAYAEINQAEINGEKRWGARAIVGRRLLLCSPVNDTVVSLDIDDCTAEPEILHSRAALTGGCMGLSIEPDRETLWILPYEGSVLTKWNMRTGELKEYSGVPENFRCYNRIQQCESMERPFANIAFDGDYAYIAPLWGNMFIRMERSTGRMEEWTPPFPLPDKTANGYYSDYTRGNFVEYTDEHNSLAGYGYFSFYDRKLYRVDFAANTYAEILIVYDREELRAHEPGFCLQSEWFPYAALEGAFHSLADFVDGRKAGAAYDRDRQLAAFESVTANHDGTCGEHVHRFVKERLPERGRKT